MFFKRIWFKCLVLCFSGFLQTALMHNMVRTLGKCVWSQLDYEDVHNIGFIPRENPDTIQGEESSICIINMKS